MLCGSFWEQFSEEYVPLQPTPAVDDPDKAGEELRVAATGVMGSTGLVGWFVFRWCVYSKERWESTSQL